MTPPPDHKAVEAREIKLPVYKLVPRWLILQQEIDYRLFLVEKITKDAERQDAITRLVDEATGFKRQMDDDLIMLAAELRWLKMEYDKEVQT